MSFQLILLVFLIHFANRLGQAEKPLTYGNSTVHAEFDAKCTDSLFVVYFNKTAFDEKTSTGNRPYSIKFFGKTSENCTANANRTENIDSNYTASMPTKFTSSIFIGTNLTENMCGINVFSDANNIIYNTTIVVTYGKNPPNSLIVREEYDFYNVMCLMKRNVTEKLNNYKFDVQYRAAGKDAQNHTTDFPLKLSVSDLSGNSKAIYKVGEYLKFVMDFESKLDVKAVIQSCWASSDGSSNKYNLITERCNFEQGSNWIGTPRSKISQFKTEAFRYLTGTNAVYVECSVRVCLTNDNSMKCTLCTNARKRRAVAAASIGDGKFSENVALVKTRGFYVIRDDRESVESDSATSSPSVFDGTNGLIIVILLSLLVFLIAVGVIKKFFCTSPAPYATPSSSCDDDGHEMKC